MLGRDHPPLTKKQLRFVEEYCSDDPHVVRAFIRAGYSEHHADANAYHLYHKPAVQEAIKKKLGIRAEQQEGTAQKAMASFHRIAEKAEEEGNYANALRAWENLAKIAGLFVEKTESKHTMHLANNNQEHINSEVERLTAIITGKANKATTEEELEEIDPEGSA